MINKTVQTNFIRKIKVLEKTALSDSTLYYFIKNGSFPPPYKLGERSVAWKEDEVDEWINSREKSCKSENIYDTNTQYWKKKKDTP